MKKGCWCCFRGNCLIKQHISRKYNIKRRYSEGCVGKILKFKQLLEKPNVSETTAEQHTATITAAKPFDDNSDEELHRLVNLALEGDETNDVSFQQCSARISPQTFTEDMIPDPQLLYSETRDIRNSSCVLCNKKNISVLQLHKHFIYSHDIYWGDESDDSQLEDWVEAFNRATPYDPENATSDDEESQQSSNGSSESSSEESASEYSSSQTRKKRKKCKRSVRIEKQVKEVKEKIEFNYDNANYKIEQNSIQLENINRNLQSLTSSAKSFQDEIKSEQRIKNDAIEKLATSQQETTNTLSKSMQLLSEKICNSETSLKNDLTSQVDKSHSFMQETSESLNKSVQLLSEKISDSENSLKKNLTSQIDKSNIAIGMKVSKLEKYIELLESRLEKRQQTPVKGDPSSGQRSLENSFNAVQKSPVNLQPAPIESYQIEQQDNKGTMKFDSNQSPSGINAQEDKPHDTSRHSTEEHTAVDETQEMDSYTSSDQEIEQEEITPTAEDLKVKQEGTPPSSDDSKKKQKKKLSAKKKANLNPANKKKKMQEESYQNQAIKLQLLKNERARMRRWDNLFNGLPGLIWGAMFFLSILTLKVAANPTSEAQIREIPLTSLISSPNTNAHFTVYSLESLVTKNYQYELNEIRLEITSRIESACLAIPELHQACQDHPASCQSVEMSITNYENSIRVNAQSLYTMERLCETSDHPTSDVIINRCHDGLQWSPREDPTKDFPLLTSMFESYTTEFLQQQRGGTSTTREKRFAVSVPIIDGTAIGASSMATAGVTAMVIAQKETNRVIEEVNENRITDINYALYNNKLNLNVSTITEALATDAVNSFTHATQLNNEIAHLLSDSAVIRFSDPATETWFNGITELNTKMSVGLTNSEIKEKSQISADITNLVTTLIPLNNRSHRCEDMMILKTLVVPIIDHTSRMEVQIVNDTIQQTYGNSSTHIIISENAAVSKQTRMFGTSINVFSRTCEVDNSVNATSSPSTDPLVKSFTFKFDGNLTLEEICPSNGSSHTFNWTFTSMAIIKLPVVCSIRSTLVNCRAVKITSGATKESHLSHYRMEIMETHVEEKEVNKTKFVRQNIQQKPTTKSNEPALLEKFKWPLIGTGATFVVMVILISMAIKIKQRSGGEVSVKIENNSSPTFQINNSSQHLEVASPSAPAFNPSFMGKGEQKKDSAIITLQDGINAIKAIKPENRTPVHDRDLQIYLNELERQKTSSSHGEQA